MPCPPCTSRPCALPVPATPSASAAPTASALARAEAALLRAPPHTRVCPSCPLQHVTLTWEGSALSLLNEPPQPGLRAPPPNTTKPARAPSPAGKAPRPLGRGLLIQQEPGEWGRQLARRDPRPGQPQALLQLRRGARERCRSEMSKPQGSLARCDPPKLSVTQTTPTQGPSHRFPRRLPLLCPRETPSTPGGTTRGRGAAANCTHTRPGPARGTGRSHRCPERSVRRTGRSSPPGTGAQEPTAGAGPSRSAEVNGAVPPGCRLGDSESPSTPRPVSPYVFGGRSLHRHGNQVLPSQQHQTQNPLLFTLRLLRVLWPKNQR